MKYSTKLDYVFVVIGCSVAVYVQFSEQQHLMVLVTGIAILMYGLFKISVKIPHKKKKDEESDI